MEEARHDEKLEKISEEKDKKIGKLVEERVLHEKLIQCQHQDKIKANDAVIERIIKEK